MYINRRWQIAYLVGTVLLAIAAAFERRWGSLVAWGFLSVFWAFMLWKERDQ